MSREDNDSHTTSAVKGPSTLTQSGYGALLPDAESFRNILSMMREMQQKSKTERRELVEGIGQQLRGARMDQFRLIELQHDVSRQLHVMIARLNAAGAPNGPTLAKKLQEIPPPSSGGGYGLDALSGFSMDTPVKSGRHDDQQFSMGNHSRLGGGGADANNSSVEQQLNLLHESVRKATEEAELLKMALFNDRTLREERQAAEDIEDHALEERIRQAEVANDAMRSEINAIGIAMHKSVELLEAMDQHERHNAVPPQFNPHELDRLVVEVQSIVERVRAEHAALHGRLESVESFATTEEERRREALKALEASIQGVEASLKQDVAAKKHLPFQPTLHDVSSDWLKGRRDASTPSAVAEPAAAGTHRLRAPGAAATPDPQHLPPQHNHGYSGVGAIPALRKTMADMTPLSLAAPLADGGVWPPSRATERRSELEDTLERFYALYNPDKCSEVAHILDEYEGAEEELFAALEVHYGCFGYFSQ